MSLSLILLKVVGQQTSRRTQVLYGIAVLKTFAWFAEKTPEMKSLFSSVTGRNIGLPKNDSITGVFQSIVWIFSEKVFRWGTHLYMSLFLSIRLSVTHHISETVHHVFIIFSTRVKWWYLQAFVYFRLLRGGGNSSDRKIPITSVKRHILGTV